MALALLLTTSATGCRSAMKAKTTSTPQTVGVPTATSPESTPVQKTEFRKDASPEQQFNVHLEVARLYESQGDNEAALGEYQKAVELCEKKGRLASATHFGPNQQAIAQRRMAGCLDRMGRFAQAETHYLKALKLSPKDPKVWNDAGYSYYLQGRWADAERSLQTADSMEPNNPRVLTNLGLTLAASGRDDDALSVLTRAAGPAIGHANLGYILAALGKSELARQHYQQALTIQPELQAARTALAKLENQATNPNANLLAAAAPATTTTPVKPAAIASQDPAVKATSTTAPEKQRASVSTPPLPPPSPAPPAVSPVPPKPHVSRTKARSETSRPVASIWGKSSKSKNQGPVQAASSPVYVASHLPSAPAASTSQEPEKKTAHKLTDVVLPELPKGQTLKDPALIRTSASDSKAPNRKSNDDLVELPLSR